MNMKISKILCAVNDDPLSESVFEIAFDLAQRLGAEFALVSVLDQALLIPDESGYTIDKLRASFKRGIDQLFDRLLQKQGNPNVSKFCEEGDPKKMIVSTAHEWGADLVVIASHARSGLSRVLMGSVAESVVRHSKCPVLIVPAQK